MADNSSSQPGAWINIGNGRVYSETFGSGRPVVLVHAGIGDRRIWDPVIPRLAAEFQVTRYDIRGFGKSPVPDKPFSPVQDLAHVADYVSGNPVAIVGISIGAAMAIDLELAQPGRAGALVLAAPVVTGGSPPTDPALDAAEAAAQRGSAHEAVDLELEYWAPLGVAGPGGSQLYQMAHDNAATMLLDEDLVMEPPPAAGRLGEIGVPTLVIVGDRDTDYIKNVSAQVCAEIPNCREAVIIENADHLIPLRQPAAFAESVIVFLRDTWQ
jgi:pimeloyl-ACP methyl ester carboxylesterase